MGKDVRRDADRAQTENTRGVALMRKGDYEQAEKALKGALLADVMHGPAHNNLGKVYFHQHRYYLAAWEFQYASKLMPNQPEPRNNLGLVYEAVGKLDDAIKSYDQARTLDPDSAEFIGNLVRSRIRQGERSPEMRALLEELVLRETRADWSSWAREQLALIPSGTNKMATPATERTGIGQP